MPYAYITLDELTAALLQRLQDTAGVFTTTAEAQIYITESLRVLNAQVAIWNIDYVLDFNPGDAWKSLNIAGSPRQRTVTDTDMLTQMEYMLLEPPTGGVWTGTKQFNITNLSNALQFRRDELLLLTGSNVVNLLGINSPTAGVRTLLPDSTLDVRRVRWVPDSSVSTVSPYSLWREDINTVKAFGATLSQQTGAPDSWLITANSPLAFDVSETPNITGQWDMLAYYSGASLAPPSPTVLGLPDDWCWVAMYGALADCLSNSPEATDIARAKYCLQRYEQGKKAMMKLPWLLDASVEGIQVDTPSFLEMDAYSQNWENDATGPAIVVGGMDFVALAPFVKTNSPSVSSLLTVVGNAPIPTDEDSYIQLSRDGVEAILNYSQTLAMFKTGGADFAETLPLLKQFEDYCAIQNSRYQALGVMRFETILEGFRDQQIDPTFGPGEGEHGKPK